MKHALLFALFLFLQFPTAPATSADGESIEQAAIAFQAARFQATVNADLEALDNFLSDELVYTHTTGNREDKSQFLATIESGRINYLSLEAEEVQVRIYGDIAVMTGIASLTGRAGDREAAFRLRFLDVSKRTGDAWQLVAWQSVRIPEPDQP